MQHWVTSTEDVLETSMPRVPEGMVEAALPRMPVEELQELAAALVAASKVGETICIQVRGIEAALAPEFTALLGDMFGSVARGHRAAVVVDEDLLSPEDVATLLGVSRPFVYKLMDRGELPVAREVGSHRKVSAQDALAWLEEQDARTREADRIAAEAESSDDETRRRQLFEAGKVAAATGDTEALKDAARVSRVAAGAAAAQAAARAAVDERTPDNKTSEKSANRRSRSGKAKVGKFVTRDAAVAAGKSAAKKQSNKSGKARSTPAR